MSANPRVGETRNAEDADRERADRRSAHQPEPERGEMTHSCSSYEIERIAAGEVVRMAAYPAGISGASPPSTRSSVPDAPDNADGALRRLG